MFAIISDIHGNYDALVEVFKDLDRRNVSEVICLGDIVGYGPEPEKCVDLVASRCRFTVCGNHDFSLIQGMLGCCSAAREALEVIRQKMQPKCYEVFGEKKARWKFLENLPIQKEEGDALFVHGSPRDPLCEYLFTELVPALFSEELILSNFRLVKKYCFVGHTHQPGIILDDATCIHPAGEEFTCQIPAGQKAIINAGAVGQPRDKNPRASYIIVDGRKITFRRIPYNIESVIQKIVSRHINIRCGNRLREGV